MTGLAIFVFLDVKDKHAMQLLLTDNMGNKEEEV